MDRTRRANGKKRLSARVRYEGQGTRSIDRRRKTAKWSEEGLQNTTDVNDLEQL